MDEKPSATEQAFDEFWLKGIWPTTDSLKEMARLSYLAATERTARRCMEICRECDEKNWDAEDCGVVIAKEFGLE